MDAFEILSEPSRRRLLTALLAGAKPVNELVEACRMSQPVVSRHLKLLREAGLVSVTPDGQRRYRLTPEPLAEVDEWLMPYRRLWAGRLDALEAHLLDRHGPPAQGRAEAGQGRSNPGEGEAT